MNQGRRCLCASRVSTTGVNDLCARQAARVPPRHDYNSNNMIKASSSFLRVSALVRVFVRSCVLFCGDVVVVLCA